MPFTLYTEEIVISGISAKLPDSSNLEDFRTHLLAGTDMVTEDRPRWKPGFLGLPKRNGRLMELNRFDASFFGIHKKAGQSMDPQLRMLLELTYEAIIDAGVNPAEIRGSSTGVFIGVSGSDSESFQSFHPDLINGYVSPGHHRSMLANRISYSFDFKGPSFPIDTACSSSMLALESAVNAIRLGKCDAAIVGGSNLILHPYASYHSHKLGMFSPDGKCKSFDASGNGYVRSEGVAVIFIQKQQLARRAYATILNIRSNTDGFKDNGVTFPSGKVQKQLLEETYAEIEIDPSTIGYFEAHGTGTAAGDPQELNSVAEVFCKNRAMDNPLLIGSVKSNAGHLEPVAGLASIAKMIIAMQEGVLPANLHYAVPNPEIPALVDGRFKVVTENTKWAGGLFGINSFGWGGANVHAIFRSFPRSSADDAEINKIPLLIPLSGRTEEAVQFGLHKIIQVNHNQREVVALSHEIHKEQVMGHPYRGVALLDGVEVLNVRIQEVNEGALSLRPIWYIFSGMGSQSSVVQLLSIKPFRDSINESAAILQQVGYDLTSSLISKSPEHFENVTNSFVNIVAVQIALVDTLKALGIHPDGLIGHSIGEVSCGYADGGTTHEETILLTYWRGMSLTETSCPPGGMAAIGLSFSEASARCPQGVVVACQNTADSVTVSGPIEPLNTFIEELKASGVFAKLVPTSGFAFHSQYVEPATPYLREKLESVFPKVPRTRSTKWISTSVPDVNSPLAQTCSIDYQLNNLVSPVLFADALTKIPSNAIVIELAPHALLQALLRRGLPGSCTRIGLTNRSSPNHVVHLLENLSALYLEGVKCNFAGLYEPVQFPVPVDTPMLAPLVQWKHDFSWNVASFSKPYKTTGESILDLSLANEEYSYLEDHVIDGRNICPVMMYIYAVWKSYAVLNQSSLDQFPVEFEEIHFHRPILLSKTDTVRFHIQILAGSGQFEIEEGNMLLASGKIKSQEMELNNNSSYSNQLSFVNLDLDSLGKTHVFAKADLYKEMKLRGYEYKTRFMGLNSLDFDGRVGRIEWSSNWVTFLDSMLHALILKHRTRNLDLPASIRKLAIDPTAFQEFYDKNASAKKEGMPIVVNHDLDTLTCPGIELHGLGTNRASRKPVAQKLPMYNESKFVPYLMTEGNDNDTEATDTDTRAITVLFDIILDNSSKLGLELVECVGVRGEEDSILPHLKEVDSFRVEYKLDRTTYISSCTESWKTDRSQEGSIIMESDDPAEEFLKMQGKRDVVVIHELAQLEFAMDAVEESGFIILISSDTSESQFQSSNSKEHDFPIVCHKKFNGRHIYLARKIRRAAILEREYQIINIDSTSTTSTSAGNDFSWFEGLKSAMVKSSTLEEESRGAEQEQQQQQQPRREFRILLVSLHDPQSGIVGLVRCLRKEPGGSALRYVFSQNPKFEFNLDQPSAQLQRILASDLVHNVIDKEQRYGFHSHGQFFHSEQILAGNSFVDMETEGDVQSFRWIESPPAPAPAPQHLGARKQIDLHYAVLNLGELITASNAITNANFYDPASELGSGHVSFGIEYSGVDSSTGKRYMGISDKAGLATTATVDAAADGFLVELPEGVSLKDGATMPMAYLTAIYGLVVRGRLSCRDTLLIHDAASSMGQAALHLAMHVNAQVYVTIATEEEKQFLRDAFPQLNEAQILPSDPCTFEPALQQATHGKGVSIVLNTLTGKGLEASIRCTKNNGSFIDISRNELIGQNNSIPTFSKNIRYHTIRPDLLTDKENPERELVLEEFQRLLHACALKAINSTVFRKNELEMALKSTATQKQMGKTLLALKEQEESNLSNHSKQQHIAFPRTYFNPDKVFILAGGLGDTGLEMAAWMISRGCKKLILANRSGIVNSYQAYQVRNWKESGVQVRTPRIDITKWEDVERLVQHTHGAPIGGIFNLSMVLRDSFIATMSYEDFLAAVQPKVIGTRNLDLFSRKYAPELEYFVVFSSITSARGNEGQCNYGFGNSMTERLLEDRLQEGLPGMAIQFGPIADVGYVEYGMGGSSAERVIAGTHPQRIRSVLNSLDKLLKEPKGIKCSAVIAQKKKGGASSAGGPLSILESIGGILGVPEPSKLNSNSKLGELGMDSLMAVEMRQMIERDFGLFHSIQELRTFTIGELVVKGRKNNYFLMFC